MADSYIGIVNEFKINRVYAIFSVPRNKMSEEECRELIEDEAKTLARCCQGTYRRDMVGRGNVYSVWIDKRQVAEVKFHLVESII